jgi:hypothetical protein
MVSLYRYTVMHGQKNIKLIVNVTVRSRLHHTQKNVCWVEFTTWKKKFALPLLCIFVPQFIYFKQPYGCCVDSYGEMNFRNRDSAAGAEVLMCIKTCFFSMTPRSNILDCLYHRLVYEHGKKFRGVRVLEVWKEPLQTYWTNFSCSILCTTPQTVT